MNNPTSKTNYTPSIAPVHAPTGDHSEGTPSANHVPPLNREAGNEEKSSASGYAMPAGNKGCDDLKNASTSKTPTQPSTTTEILASGLEVSFALDTAETSNLEATNAAGKLGPVEFRVKCATLYVGDLHPDVDERALCDIFDSFGPIQSVRVCRDVVTQRSLSYAYVNFDSVGAAQKALESLNFYEGPETRNRPLRLMWKLRDPAKRRTGEGNIFVKGLHHSIDNKTLFDTFSQFGPILSAKVVINDARESMGYGFVHFESPIAAAEAIRLVNGMLLLEKKVAVERFLHKSERDAKPFTNLYVKHLAISRRNEAGLREIFAEFGTITSLHFPMNTDGTAAGYAFVNFRSHISAQKALSELNGKEIDGIKLYVNRFQKKSERLASLDKKYARLSREKEKKRLEKNLYIKNISEEVDEGVLRELFSPFGDIASLVVIKDENGRSRGFGFVCYYQPEHSRRAITEMNGKIIGTKIIYVSIAESQEERRQRLRNKNQTPSLFIPGAM